MGWKKRTSQELHWLKDELKTSNAIIKTLSNKNFTQAVEIEELKQKLASVEQERDLWRSIAYDVDRYRRLDLPKMGGVEYSDRTTPQTNPQTWGEVTPS